MRRKASIILTIFIIFLYVGLFVITTTSLHSISSTLLGSLTSIEEIEYVSTEQNSTGTFRLTAQIPARNSGILDVNVRMSVRFYSDNGTIIAEDTDSKRIEPGEIEEFTIAVTFIPENVYSVDIYLECRSFFGMIGLSFSTYLEDFPTSEE